MKQKLNAPSVHSPKQMALGNDIAAEIFSGGSWDDTEMTLR